MLTLNPVLGVLFLLSAVVIKSSYSKKVAFVKNRFYERLLANSQKATLSDDTAFLTFSLCPLLADIQHERMINNFIALLFGDRVLTSFDFRVHKLDYLVSVDIDHMVMMVIACQFEN